MLSNNQKKLIRSLHQKKYRLKHGLFSVEGDKIVSDLLSLGKINSSNLHFLVAGIEWINKHHELLGQVSDLIVSAEDAEIKYISSMITPPEVIAVVKMPQHQYASDIPRSGYTLVLESVRDPGNLGTIIRTAAWFGIRQIICSVDSVDQYNNKVVQASMGAIFSLQVTYESIRTVLSSARESGIPVYGTMLDGENIFQSEIKPPALLVFGNESRGISEDLKSLISHKILIPSSVSMMNADLSSGHGKNIETGQAMPGVESLNVASAVACVLTECMRRDK